MTNDNEKVLSLILNQYRFSELMILRQSYITRDRIIQLIDDIRQWVNVNEREQSDTLNQVALEIVQNINDLVNRIERNNSYLSELYDMCNELEETRR